MAVVVVPRTIFAPSDGAAYEVDWQDWLSLQTKDSR